MIDGVSPLTAPLAAWVGGKEIRPGLFPIAVISARPGVRPPGIGPGFALSVARGDHRASLARLVNATAVTADTRPAGRHHATGAMAGLPRTMTAPAAMLVPLALVMTARRYRFLPM